jgi:hypothetical protein
MMTSSSMSLIQVFLVITSGGVISAALGLISFQLITKKLSGASVAS